MIEWRIQAACRRPHQHLSLLHKQPRPAMAPRFRRKSSQSVSILQALPRIPYSPISSVPVGLAFIATAFFVVVLGFFLRMYLARRRIQAQGEPAPTWLDVFFSIVESRHGRGRAATSGFLYFEPGFGFRRPWDASKGPAEALPIPTLYDCDVELGSEFRDKQIPMSQVSPSVRESGRFAKAQSRRYIQ